MNEQVTIGSEDVGSIGGVFAFVRPCRFLTIRTPAGEVAKVSEHDIRHAVAMLVAVCHGAAAHAGWWNDPKTGGDLRGAKSWHTLMLLQISEIIEGFEGQRKGLQDDHLPQYKMLDVEQADAAIRLFDSAGGMQTQFVDALVDKLFYNAQRADHKPENRVKDGGKAF